MKVSLNTIKQYTAVDISVDELVSKINQQLGGVEEVIDLGVRYKDALIVRIVTADQHPNADRLRVCLIDDGGVRQNVPRDNNGYIQIVCGAPNAEAGKLVVWLPPSSTVPASFEEKELFVLSARELRGVLSQGMLAAADELAIGSDHEGILEINVDEWKPSSEEIKPGASFAKVYGLDDFIIDIENKMFTHRPDCFGQLGVAREIAGIQHRAFTSPEWYAANPDFQAADNLPLDVDNQIPEGSPRFMAVAMNDVIVRPSPLWLQCELVRLGSKPINNIVDVTNYIMLQTGQPLHAYDYDKISGNKLIVRMAKKGEILALLNGKTIELDDADIVIADTEKPIGLAGIMGGSETEVSNETTNVILECANFDMYTIRKSSMRHGLFTDAVTRFSKGQSPLQNLHVLHLAAASLIDVAGGTQASQVIDSAPGFDRESAYGALVVSAQFINDRLGLSLDDETIISLLENVEFNCTRTDSGIKFEAPFWRTDIQLPEDIVEEVGRLYGFDKLPRELPSRSIKPAPISSSRQTKQQVRETLAKYGANEVLSYSFVHGQTIEKAGQNIEEAFRLSNALSPDLQYYRLSVLPSLLERVHPNIKAGYDEFALFEIGKRHNKRLIDADEDGLPRGISSVDIVYARKKPLEGSAFYHAKKLVGQLFDELGIEMYTVPLDQSECNASDPTIAPFEPTHTAALYTKGDDRYAGVVGELKAAVIKGFKLPPYSSAASIELSELTRLSSKTKRGYKPLSKFPGTERDVTLKVSASTLMRDIVSVMQQELTNDDLIDIKITPVGVYQESDAEAKNVTLRLKLGSQDRTLVGDEVNAFIDERLTRVCTQLQATIV